MFAYKSIKPLNINSVLIFREIYHDGRLIKPNPLVEKISEEELIKNSIFGTPRAISRAIIIPEGCFQI